MLCGDHTIVDSSVVLARNCRERDAISSFTSKGVARAIHIFCVVALFIWYDYMVNVHFSSKTNEWYTPQDFYDQLHREFKFTLDPCANAGNAKCDRYYTQSDNGLSKTWDNENVFCNPPYGREIGKWVKKASEATGG